jgi:predicted RNA binding protein YcfA (HicA-like mRNA interferase family)
MAKLPRDADPRKVLKALGRFGWEIQSTKGSHVHLFNRDRPGVVLTVPFHTARGVSPGALRSLLRIAGISVDEFVELL